MLYFASTSVMRLRISVSRMSSSWSCPLTSPHHRMHDMAPEPRFHLLWETQSIELHHVRMLHRGAILRLTVGPTVHRHTRAPVIVLRTHRSGGVLQDVANAVTYIPLPRLAEILPFDLYWLTDDAFPFPMRLPSELRDVLDGHQIIAGRVVFTN